MNNIAQREEAADLAGASGLAKIIAANDTNVTNNNNSNLSAFLLCLSLIAAGLLYSAIFTQTRFGTYHDDGIYVTTAKAVATGSGYRIISLPDEPLQTKYPPFYPSVLSLIWRAYPEFPANLTWMMLLSVIATIGYLLATYKYLITNDYALRWQAFAVVTLTALNWRTMILATSVYSEMMFSFLAIAALHFAEKQERAKRPSLISILGGVFVGLAFLTRSSGFALLISLAMYQLIRRKSKKPLLIIIVSSLFVIAWIVWCYVNRSTADGVNVPYYTSYLGHLNQVVNDLQAQSGSSRATVFLDMAVRNLVGGILVSVPLVSAGLTYNAFTGLSAPIVAAALCAAFLCLVLIVTGFGRSLRKGIRLLHLYIVTSLGLYLFWLPDVSYDRFLMPLLPFFLLFLVRELCVIVSLAVVGLRSHEKSRRISGIFIALVAIFVAGIIVYGNGSGTYSSFLSLRASAARAADDVTAISWINEHSDSSDVLICYRDPKYFLYTGHKAVRSFPMTEGFSWEDDQQSIEKLSQAIFSIIIEANARYLVVTATDFELEDRPEQHRQTFDKILEQHARNFTLVFRSVDGRCRIYRIEMKPT